MKNYLLLFFLFLFNLILINNNFTENKTVNNYQVISSFCDYKTDYFNTGIELSSKDEKAYSISEGELVFYNKNRPGNIGYKNENFIVIENKIKELRFNYFNLKSEYNDTGKTYFKEGDEIDNLKSIDDLKMRKLYFEVEDIKNKKILNPLGFLNITDSIPPNISDIYFKTDDNQIISLKRKGEYKVKRGGKIFIECFDKNNNFNANLMPYSIQILIDGIEKSNLIFNSLNKNNSNFTVGKDRNFKDIYLNKKNFDFYLIDYYGLPGLIGFQVIATDNNGNKSFFKRNLVILPPD